MESSIRTNIWHLISVYWNTPQSPREASKTCRIHASRKKSPHMDAVTEPLLGNSPDQPGSKRSATHSTPSPTRTECRGAGDLQCPYCFSTYDGMRTTEYMKHLEECARLWVRPHSSLTGAQPHGTVTNSKALHDPGLEQGPNWQSPLNHIILEEGPHSRFISKKSN